jgi:hypothetical protein
MIAEPVDLPRLVQRSTVVHLLWTAWTADYLEVPAVGLCGLDIVGFRIAICDAFREQIEQIAYQIVPERP